MFKVGDIFKINDKEYRFRHINQGHTCWLEPVLHRDSRNCITGGLNAIYTMDELEKFEYFNVCY